MSDYSESICQDHFPRAKRKIKKIPLDHCKHTGEIQALSLRAIAMRRKIVEMGYANHIRLHYGALMSMVEIMTALYLCWLEVDPAWPDWPRSLAASSRSMS